MSKRREDPGDRIETLLEDLRGRVDREAFLRVEELVRCVVGFYGEGLQDLVEALGELGESGAAVRDRLLRSDAISSLLLLHGLHPEDLATRIERGLARVRPYLVSHGGDVELVAVDEARSRARLRLVGSCDGCPSSRVTLELAVEGAIRAEAPELGAIEVEPPGRPAEGLLPIEGLGPPVGGPARTDAARWEPADRIFADLAPGGLRCADLSGHRVLACRVADDRYAYVDSCATCGGTLARASLEGDVLSCSCGARFDVRRAGRALAGEAHLEPLPLLHGESGARLAVPAA